MRGPSPRGQGLKSHFCFPQSTSISETEKTHPLISHSYAPHPSSIATHPCLVLCFLPPTPVPGPTRGPNNRTGRPDALEYLQNQGCPWASFQGLQTELGISWITDHYWLHGDCPDARRTGWGWGGKPFWHTGRLKGEDVEAGAAGRRMRKAKHQRPCNLTRHPQRPRQPPPPPRPNTQNTVTPRNGDAGAR